MKFVLIVALVLTGLLAAWRTVHAVRSRRVDWAAIGFIVAFVLLAVWLRGVTGISGIM